MLSNFQQHRSAVHQDQPEAQREAEGARKDQNLQRHSGQAGIRGLQQEKNFEPEQQKCAGSNLIC